MPVLDIACDRGYFIRNVTRRALGRRTFATFAAPCPPDVRFVQADGLDLAASFRNVTFGTVFMSNYLEHLPDARRGHRQLAVASACFGPGSRIDPAAEHSAGGRRLLGLHRPPRRADREEPGRRRRQLADLKVVRLITRFLPYSTAGPAARGPRLVRAYLEVPADVALLGRQTLLVATPEMSPELSIVMPVLQRGRSWCRSSRGLDECASPNRVEILVVYDFDEDTPWPPLRALASQMPTSGPCGTTRPGCPQRLEGGHLAASNGTFVLVTMADGSDEPEVDRPHARAGPRGRGRGRREPIYAGRPADRRTAVEAADEPRRGPVPALVGGATHPRPDEQLQALPPRPS